MSTIKCHYNDALRSINDYYPMTVFLPLCFKVRTERSQDVYSQSQSVLIIEALKINDK